MSEDTKKIKRQDHRTVKIESYITRAVCTVVHLYSTEYCTYSTAVEEVYRWRWWPTLWALCNLSSVVVSNYKANCWKQHFLLLFLNFSHIQTRGRTTSTVARLCGAPERKRTMTALTVACVLHWPWVQSLMESSQGRNKDSLDAWIQIHEDLCTFFFQNGGEFLVVLLLVQYLCLANVIYDKA